MAYIDREAAIQRLMAPKPDSPDLTPFCLCLGDRIDVQRFLEFCPDADVSPVVRCRDCKHWKPNGSKAGNSFEDMEFIGGCEFTQYYRRESDFCSWGKRKEGADNV